ncbi:MAG: PTS transporter subunit EIIC [Treponema sp.]|nr:PTS transporter subunit EIIC [Treponema sp.]
MENKTDNKEKTSFGKKIVDNLTGIFLPVINLITAASIMKSILILLVTFGVMTPENGIYRIFYAVSDGFFYFLPFFLAATASRQWKTDMFISMMIPVAMLYPDLMNLLENGQTFPFLGINVPQAIYHSSVIPVLLAVGLLKLVELPCDRFLPEVIKGFVKPIICMCIVLTFTFLLFGPLGTWIGSGLTKLFFLLYDWNSIVAGAFMGLLIQPMVVIGAHWAIVPIALNNIATQGFDVIMPLLGAAVYGQAGAAFAVALKCRISTEKGKFDRQIAIQSGFTACLGVTEPALYSVNLPRVWPLFWGCIAGAVGGALAGFAGNHCISFAFPSVLTCVAFAGPGFLLFMLSMLLGLISGFVLTYLFYREKA